MLEALRLQEALQMQVTMPPTVAPEEEASVVRDKKTKFLRIISIMKQVRIESLQSLVQSLSLWEEH